MTDLDKRDVFKDALSLAGLAFDWNSYESQPIEQRAINAACEFLVEHADEEVRKRAQVVPIANGGVQVEWHIDGADLEIEWGPRGNIKSLYRADAQGHLPELIYDRAEGHTGEIIKSWTISAIGEWPPARA